MKQISGFICVRVMSLLRLNRSDSHLPSNQSVRYQKILFGLLPSTLLSTDSGIPLCGDTRMWFPTVERPHSPNSLLNLSTYVVCNCVVRNGPSRREIFKIKSLFSDHRSGETSILIYWVVRKVRADFTMKNCIYDTFVKNERNLNLKKGF